jgi:predicted XRE-type DNA-binding protein
MNIDTEIRHITKAGTNIFLDLGFDVEEAEQLHAESRRQINETLVLKEQLINELTKWMTENHLKQAQAAEILNVSRPRVSDLVNKKSNKFTFDTLLNMLSKVGKKVSIGIY